MRLFLLYGPPAAGKLTIAQLLSKKLEIPLLHNHLIQNSISEVFSPESPTNSLLVREFRLKLLDALAEEDKAIVATFGVVSNNPFSHLSDIISTVEAKGGTINLIHVTADSQILLERVTRPSRQEADKNLSKERLQDLLRDNPAMLTSYPGRDQLTLDTSKITPHEAMDQIMKYYF